MVSARTTVLLLAAYAASVMAASKPYAPDLYARSALIDSEKVMKRQVASGSQPYAPNLYSRSEVEAMPIAKRSPSPALESSSWSPLSFLGMREFSEEELHARGKIEDSVIEKRGWCSSDSQCGSSQYCSSKKSKCYQKLSTGKTCTRNGACSTGYCCATSGKCEATRVVGAKCHDNDGACDSGYCSVKSSTCASKATPNGSCWVDGGCQNGYSCVNRTCQKTQPSKQPTSPSKNPHHPSPSGSKWNKRELKHL